MVKKLKVLIPAIASLLLITGCETINADGSAYQKTRLSMDGVLHFSVIEPNHSEIPDCVAVLPFTTSEDLPNNILKSFRASVAGKVATLRFRDVELDAIDATVLKFGLEDSAKISQELSCDGLIYGEIISTQRIYAGVFSHISIRAKLHMIDAANGSLIWKSEHTSNRNGGNLPMSIPSAITGVFSAISNFSDETLLSLVDDLSRNLILTLPEPETNLQIVAYKNDKFKGHSYSRPGHFHQASLTPSIHNNLRLMDSNSNGQTRTAYTKPEIIKLIEKEAEKIDGMPSSLAIALAHVESNFKPSAESHKGARGVMQIMPQTSSKALNIHPDRLWDPNINIRAGLTFLKNLYHLYGNRWDLALSHYNGGSLKKRNGRYVAHSYTQNYVAKVMKWQKHYAQKHEKETASYTSAKKDQTVISVLQKTHAPVPKTASAKHKYWSPKRTVKSQSIHQNQDLENLIATLDALARRDGILLRNRAW